jgi:uroporphyrinogen-III synthase
MLCRRIKAEGGESISLPALNIEPLVEPVLVSTDPDPGPHAYDVAVFVSPNAVAHGLKAAPLTPETRIAAIGRSTAAALVAAGVQPTIVPEAGFTSEALLAHPDLATGAATRVLIVRGGAGREILETTLTERGIETDCLEVYRRIPAVADPRTQAAVDAAWADPGIDIVTATSGEILHNLYTMLGDAGRKRLATTPLLVVSPRLIAVARSLGCHGEILVAPAADDDALTGTLAEWHTRARQF